MIPLRPHVIAVLLANRLAFSSLLFVIRLLLVEVSSEVRLVVIADVTACCALRHVELQWGHAHTCIFQVGNCLCVKRKHIHDHLGDLLHHVEERAWSLRAAVVAVRQSRYLLPSEVVVGDNGARVRAHLHHFCRGQHQVASALMEFWAVVDTHEYSSAAYA